MTTFKQGCKYFVKQEGEYYLEFLCLDYDGKKAQFRFVAIKADTRFSRSPVLFAMLSNYYTYFHDKEVKVSRLSEIECEDGVIREVAYSDCESYFRIDSKNIVE